MAASGTPTAHGLNRRTFLALSAAGTAAAALAACGGSATAPTDTPAPTKVAATTGPAATATAVPQSLGNTASPATAPTTTGTTTASSAVAPATVAPTAAASATNLAATQTFRYAGPEPINFDPANCQDPVNEPQVFEGLVTVSWKDGTLQPAMAQSYQTNADATVWTFKMRPGMQWSDGTPLTAKDFEYAWRRVVDPKTASIYTASLASVKNALEVVKGTVPPEQLGAKALDDATFEVTLNTPAPYFPLLAATWTCFPTPQHVIEKFGAKWLEAGNLVGNGPYILKEWKHDQLQIFEPNPNYWGPKPTITRAEFTIYDDPLTKSLPAYQNNELDSAQVAPGDYDHVLNDPNLSKDLKGYPLSQTNMIQCDATNKPTSDVRVRQALSLAFDRPTLTDIVLKKYYLPAATILPPDIAGYNPAAALTGGVAKAKQLLADAGFPNGQGWPSDFSLIYATSSVTKTILEFIQNEWKKNLGIDVQLNAMESKAYVAWRSARATQPFNAYYGGWGSDYGDPSNWHNFLFSSQTDFYHTHWKNDQFESLIAKAKGMTDQTARTKMYQDAEVILVQQGASIPINFNQAFFVTKPTVQGVYHPAVLGTYPRLKFISITK
ncbi:MAG: peptide ABC transporter substrate-binding protein [Chloroflexota bacterium]|nr:peptide ABC transporter substrate-binding protein [Chloroflexota bacterium]